MGIPQIIVIGLIGLSLGVNAAKHGEPRTEDYNIIVDLISKTIAIALLAWGGFFG